MSDFLPGVKEPKNKKCDGTQISKKKSEGPEKSPKWRQKWGVKSFDKNLINLCALFFWNLKVLAVF